MTGNNSARRSKQRCNQGTAIIHNQSYLSRMHHDIIPETDAGSDNAIEKREWKKFWTIGDKNQASIRLRVGIQDSHEKTLRGPNNRQKSITYVVAHTESQIWEDRNRFAISKQINNCRGQKKLKSKWTDRWTHRISFRGNYNMDDLLIIKKSVWRTKVASLPSGILVCRIKRPPTQQKFFN